MQIEIVKTVQEKDRSYSNAFSAKDILKITIKIPRQMQIVSPKLVISRDGGMDFEMLPEYGGYYDGCDCFFLSMHLETLCGDEQNGLFYYELRFEHNYRTLYTNSINNVDFTLSEKPARRFLLLVYEPDFTTPRCFYGGIMYHIFVDRFAKSEKEAPVRAGARLDADWQNGTPDFAPYPGAPLKNNQFFGGSLWGVLEKLDYLQSLSVDCLYLSPIFKAYSNHKYDTGDYMEIDEMFGGKEAFERLISECRARGIRIVLDGVFNHTGVDSRYFNKYGSYDSIGAYQSEQSEYSDWYHFIRFPDQYESWWGIEILPKLNIRSRMCRDFFVGKGGVCESYIKQGCGGWRLDVADELTDDFLDRLRAVVKHANPEALIVGEVWENAAEKVAYSSRRRYLRGRQLDSVMNYPTKNAIIDFVRNGDCTFLYNTVTELYASYPRCVCDCLMNILGTHDTERILTALAGSCAEGHSNAELSKLRLDPDARRRGIELLKIASTLQYTLYGFPSVFYGDEAGVEGYRDPFCRMPFPWGREEAELTAHYRFLGKLRRDHGVFAGGDFRVTAHNGGVFAFVRENSSETILILINRASFTIQYQTSAAYRDLYTGMCGKEFAEIGPDSFRILKIL